MYLQIVACAEGTASTAASAVPSANARARREETSEGSRRVIHPSLAKPAANPKRAGQAPHPRGRARRRPRPRPSQAVVHLELDRMRRHPEARDLLHLELDVRVDQIVG